MLTDLFVTKLKYNNCMLCKNSPLNCKAASVSKCTNTNLKVFLFSSMIINRKKLPY